MLVISATPNNTDAIEVDFNLSALSVENLLQNLIPNFSKNVGKEKKQNVRQDLLNELYQIYATTQDEKNRKRYYTYIRVRHPSALSQREMYYSYKDEFRKAILPDHVKYCPIIKKNDYKWWGRFSHLKGEEGKDCLRVMVSETKDIIHRKSNVISYILGASGKLSI